MDYIQEEGADLARGKRKVVRTLTAIARRVCALLLLSSRDSDVNTVSKERFGLTRKIGVIKLQSEHESGVQIR